MSQEVAKDFLPIRVSTLRGDIKIPFDAFVQVAGKYILYCRNGDSFEGSRINRMKEKKIKKLYINLEHEESYRKYLAESIETAYDPKSNKSISIRAEVIQGQQQAATEELFERPQDQAAYLNVKENTKKFVDFLNRESFAIKAIIDVKNMDTNLAHHGVNVATLATGIAEKLELGDKFPKDILALGCFLHDIEHFYTPVSYTLPLNEMPKEEKELYLQHPKRGAERVKDNKHFDPGVLKIILEHEELINGSGFPKKLKENEMDPLVMIASTANSFDRLISFQKLHPKDALKKMLIDRLGLHPLNYMKALQSVLKNQQIV